MFRRSMSKKKPAKARNFDYPAETEGGKLAAKNRAEMNDLPSDKVDELYELAQLLIHGGSAKSKMGSRH